MKKSNYFILALIVGIMFHSCSDDTISVDDGAAEGGLMSVLTSLIVHIQSSQDTYEAQIRTFQGLVKTTEVEVYKQFVGIDGQVSEKVLHTTINMIDPQNPETHTLTLTFAELKEGLTINGQPLPSDDDLNVGDKIKLTYLSRTSEGNLHAARASTEIAVSGRYAGTYVVTDSDYWRIGVQSGVWNWIGVNRVIKSIDDQTYEHVGFGPWTYDGNDYYFSEDAFFFFNVNDENKITYYEVSPDGEPVTGLGTYLITCESDPNYFVNIPCDETTNLAIKDDVEGKDQLIFSVGYMRIDDGSEGQREFYEAMQKL